MTTQEDKLEEREKKIIKELINFGIIEKTIHPISKEIVYLVDNDDKTDEVEEFASKIARMKPVKVKLYLGEK